MTDIVCDIWGGELSQEHVARFVVPLKDALMLAETELKQGFLVNLRQEVACGPYKSFDTRTRRKQ